MKTMIFALFTLISLSSAHADGFRCQGVNTGHNVKVFNFTEAASGTRTPVVMVFSDSFDFTSFNTIAKFSAENHTLSYRGYGLFEGKVDLRYQETRNKQQPIGGSTLGELKTVQLQLFAKNGQKFTYVSSAFKNADVLDAKLFYVKRTGEVMEEKAICSRYLKH